MMSLRNQGMTQQQIADSVGCSTMTVQRYMREHGESIPRKPRDDLTGKFFDRLSVTGYAGGAKYQCECICGSRLVVWGKHLRNGNTQSCGCRRGLSHGEASRNAILSSYRYHAKARGHGWFLTDAEALFLMDSNCHYCGSAPKNVQKNKNGLGDYVYSGLDRKDNTLGYTTANTTPCCYPCNRMKGKLGYTEFLSCLKAMHAHLRLGDPHV